MGTRSLTVFYDDVLEGREDQEIVVMYRQFDGYPDGHGIDLAEFLSGFTITNGLSIGENLNTANGMSCLTAQAIAHFKTDPGGIYLYPAETRDAGEEYIYEVRCPVVRKGFESKKGGLVIKCSNTYGAGEDLFEGSPEEFLAWVKETSGE